MCVRACVYMCLCKSVSKWHSVRLVIGLKDTHIRDVFTFFMLKSCASWNILVLKAMDLLFIHCFFIHMSCLHIIATQELLLFIRWKKCENTQKTAHTKCSWMNKKAARKLRCNIFICSKLFLPVLQWCTVTNVELTSIQCVEYGYPPWYIKV